MSKRDPFEVRLSAEAETELISWLATELESAINARISIVGGEQDLDYFYKLYEGGDRTIVRTSPWPEAANTHSTLGMEKTDALRSRIMKTVFVEPICVVEGWGKSADRAPFVEEFHQWKSEEERLQRYLGKSIHASLITGTGVLEVYEGAERRKHRRQMTVVVAQNEDGSTRFDDQGKPLLAKDEHGDLIPVEPVEELPENIPTAEVLVDGFVTTKRGPRYRIVPLRDFFILPGHAMDVDQVWGYAKRFWRRVPQLREREREGYYKNIDQLGEEGERIQLPSDRRQGQTVADQRGPTAEKELFEIDFLRDLDDDGVEEWYIATLHKDKRVLLRLQHEDIGRTRYVLIVPFPRDDSVYGYSFVGHKLGSLIEEHTVIGRQITDRATLVNAAPLKRVHGALWDPDEQPFGPLAIIDVRDPNEVTAMQIPDVPASLVQREQNVEQKAERAAGITDVALGVQPQESRTLGEVQLVTEQSFVRMDEVIRNIQESIEELYQLRQILWIRALEDQAEEAPRGVIDNLQLRGAGKLELKNNQFTADLLRGNFKFKPRGSVETADINRMRGDFNAFLALLTQLPGAQQKLANPAAVHALWEQAVRVYRVPNKQAFLGPDPQSAPLESMAEGETNGGPGDGGAGESAGIGGMASLLQPLLDRMGAGAISGKGTPGTLAGQE